MTLVELIQKYRAEHGLSQRQFAADCGMSNGYISMLERGKNPKTGMPITPTFPAIRKLAAGMHMTITELFETVDDMLIDISDDQGDELAKISALIEEGGFDDVDMEIIRSVMRMSPEKKQDALKYIRFLESNHSDG